MGLGSELRVPLVCEEEILGVVSGAEEECRRCRRV